MAGMPRMTISAPREVLREFIADYVDSRFAEIEARDRAPQTLALFPNDTVESSGVLTGIEAAARGPRRGDP